MFFSSWRRSIGGCCIGQALVVRFTGRLRRTSHGLCDTLSRAVEPWSRGAVEPWSRGAVEPYNCRWNGVADQVEKCNNCP